MNVESVEKLLEETAEAREYQKVSYWKELLSDALLIRVIQEVGDMLSNSLSLDEEEAVQKELLELQQDIVRQHLSSSLNDPHILQATESKVPLDIELPSVPSSIPIERPKEGRAFLNSYYSHSYMIIADAKSAAPSKVSVAG